MSKIDYSLLVPSPAGGYRYSHKLNCVEDSGAGGLATLANLKFLSERAALCSHFGATCLMMFEQFPNLEAFTVSVACGDFGAKEDATPSISGVTFARPPTTKADMEIGAQIREEFETNRRSVRALDESDANDGLSGQITLRVTRAALTPLLQSIQPAQSNLPSTSDRTIDGLAAYRLLSPKSAAKKFPLSPQSPSAAAAALRNAARIILAPLDEEPGEADYLEVKLTPLLCTQIQAHSALCGGAGATRIETMIPDGFEELAFWVGVDSDKPIDSCEMSLLVTATHFSFVQYLDGHVLARTRPVEIDGLLTAYRRGPTAIPANSVVFMAPTDAGVNDLISRYNQRNTGDATQRLHGAAYLGVVGSHLAPVLTSSPASTPKMRA